MTRRSSILASGVVLLATLTGISLFDARAHSVEFVGLMLVAGCAYVAALVLVSRGPGSRRLLLVCLLLGAAWRVALLASAPLVSDDVYRYVWDGRVQRFGVNPYETAPDDPAVRDLHTDLTRRIDPTSAELPTIYPPAAELFFRLVTTVHESVMAMVAAVLLCDALTIFVLWRWLVAMGRDPWWVIAYAWHPLVALEGAGAGHIDVVGTLLVVTAAYALTQRRTFLASAALALSVAVKFLPVVLVPLLWRRVRPRDFVMGLGVVVLLYVPFTSLVAGLPVGSLGTYAAQWRFNGPLFAILQPWLGTAGVLALATTCGFALAAVARARLGVSDPAAWAWPMAAVLLLMPAVYPWYLVWMTPFLTTRLTWPLVAWTLTSPMTYVVWGSELAGTGWVLPGWVVPLEYGVVAGVGFWVWCYSGPFSPRTAS
jgi:alpha-1,6-mannosyltransferase